MDWSKAKKIIIFAFIIVNIALLITVLNRAISAREYTTTKVDVIERLDKIDVNLEAKIPKESTDIGLLEIKYEEYETMNKKLDIANEFLSTTDLLEIAKIDNKIDSMIFENDEEKFEILKDKKLIYEDKQRNEDRMEEFDSEEVAREFLEDKPFDKNDYKLTGTKKNNDIVELTYTKEYEDTIVEKSYMKIIVKNAKVIRFERFWPNVIEEKENNIDLRPATDSLLKLLSIEDIRGKTIEEIDLCYYFDPNDLEEEFDFEELRAGDAVPSWKVKFSDGTIKYLCEE